eukprot:18086-Heterococcus_DN1.PRE.4
MHGNASVRIQQASHKCEVERLLSANECAIVATKPYNPHGDKSYPQESQIPQANRASFGLSFVVPFALHHLSAEGLTETLFARASCKATAAAAETLIAHTVMASIITVHCKHCMLQQPLR